MNKALIITSVASMVEQFLLPSAQLLQDMGYTVEVACNFESGNTCDAEQIERLKDKLVLLGIKFTQIGFERNVLRLAKNRTAYKQILALLSNDTYEVVHCHSPTGGLLTRLAARKYRRRGTKVLYTAHGFHFYSGAPLKNWLCYFPVEWLCSFWTDVLITINGEDYSRAKKCMHAGKIIHLPGVGVDVNTFSPDGTERDAVRGELGIPDNAALLLNVGELSHRKNHETLIRALAGCENACLAICGTGPKQAELEALIAELGLESRVYLLGYRTDISRLCHGADAFVFPSRQEGLSLALMEAMASGLPVACSAIRGNTDLVDARGGELFAAEDVKDCRNALLRLLSRGDRAEMGAYNIQKVQQFSTACANAALAAVYADAAEKPSLSQERK